MARATKTTTTRPSAAAVAPKKKIGRPVGSKNRVPASPRSKAAAAAQKPAVRRAAAAPAPVRMNKAELEAKILKLERSLARARAQNAELKQALKEVPQPARAETAQPAATSTKTSPAKRGRRSNAEIAAAEQAQGTEPGPSDD